MSERKDAIDDNLRAAAVSAGKRRTQKLVTTLIAKLKTRDPFWLFEDVEVRHLWDEFRWWLQEGRGFSDMRFAITSFILEELDSLEDAELLHLTAFIIDEDPSDVLLPESFGTIDKPAITEHLLAELISTGAACNVAILGPQRIFEIRHYTSSDGVVCSALMHEDKLDSILSSDLSDLMMPDSPLTELASEVMEAYFSLLEESSTSFALSDLLSNYESELEQLLLERDVLPDLNVTRANILRALDA